MYGKTSDLMGASRGEPPKDLPQVANELPGEALPAAPTRLAPRRRRTFWLVLLAILLGFACSDQIGAYLGPARIDLGELEQASTQSVSAELVTAEPATSNLATSNPATSEPTTRDNNAAPDQTPSANQTPTTNEPQQPSAVTDPPTPNEPSDSSEPSDSDTSSESSDLSLERFEASHAAMGVKFTIIGYAADEATARAAVEAAFARIDRLNSVLSDYDPNSEAMQLTREENVEQWVEISAELYEMLERGAKFSEQTQGAFDVTIGPVTKLWRASRRSGGLPADDAISESVARVSWRLIELREEPRSARVNRSGMGLDFGGIAQGYAADEAAKILKQHGLNRCLIDASGDVLALDPPPGRDAWQIGIAPLAEGGDASLRIDLVNHSISTSGDAFQFVEIDGRRYSHLIDPRTGWPVQGRSSVTVMASDGTTADALASALSIMSPNEAIAWVEAHDGIEAVIVKSEEDQIKTLKSSGFDRFLAKTVDQAESPSDSQDPSREEENDQGESGSTSDYSR